MDRFFLFLHLIFLIHLNFGKLNQSNFTTYQCFQVFRQIQQNSETRQLLIHNALEAVCRIFALLRKKQCLNKTKTPCFGENPKKSFKIIELIYRDL